MNSIVLMIASQCNACLEAVAVSGDFMLWVLELVYVEGSEKVVYDMPESISSVIKRYFCLTPFQLPT